jgi:hypothetical protein
VSIDLFASILKGGLIRPYNLEDAHKIAQLVYTAEFQASLDSVKTWFDANPDSFIHLIKNKRTIGSVIALPLRSDFMGSIASGALIDTKLPKQAIVKYNVGGDNSLYLCSLIIHPSHRHGINLKRLYDALVDHLIVLAQREVFFKEIYADAVTPMGKRLCEFLGGKPVIHTAHRSTIYHIETYPPTFTGSGAKIKELKSLYKASIERKERLKRRYVNPFSKS